VILLLLAGSVTAFVYPVYVWGDVGWYLSFFAFAGVMVIGPLIGRMLWGAREPRPLVSVVLETVSAEMMTLPIILTVFGYAPLVGLLSNVLVGPFIPLAMLLTTVAGVAGWILPSLSGWVGAPGQLLLWYVVSIVHALASLKLTYSWQMPMLVAVVMYVVVACVAVVMWRRLGFDFRARSLVE
jgi:competence protein ComEC